MNLLWSGGWDSTFRLLQLVLNENRSVQPYYLIDPQRQSLRQELIARRNIQTRLFQEYPHSKELILPTFFYEVGDIASDEEITFAYNAYRSIKEVDYQYSWLARFCKQMSIYDMELCIEARGPYPEQTYAMRVFTSFLEFTDAHSHEAHMAPEFKGTIVETIFKYFRFPIRGLTRQAMDEIATTEGWRHYLVHDLVLSASGAQCVSLWGLWSMPVNHPQRLWPAHSLAKAGICQSGA